MTLPLEAQKLLPEGRLNTLNSKQQNLVRKMGIGLSDDDCAGRLETTISEIRRQVTMIADEIGIPSGEYDVRRRALCVLGKSWIRNPLTIEEKNERFRILDAIYNFTQTKSVVVAEPAQKLEPEAVAEEEAEIEEVIEPVTSSVKVPEPQPAEPTVQEEARPTIEYRKVVTFPDAAILVQKIEQLSLDDRQVLREISESPWGGNAKLALKLGVGYGTIGRILADIYDKVSLPRVHGRPLEDARKKRIQEAFELLGDVDHTPTLEPKPRPEPSTPVKSEFIFPPLDQLIGSMKRLTPRELEMLSFVSKNGLTRTTELGKALAQEFEMQSNSGKSMVAFLYQKLHINTGSKPDFHQVKARKELLQKAFAVLRSTPNEEAQVAPEVEQLPTPTPKAPEQPAAEVRPALVPFKSDLPINDVYLRGLPTVMVSAQKGYDSAVVHGRFEDDEPCIELRERAQALISLGYSPVFMERRRDPQLKNVSHVVVHFFVLEGKDQRSVS